MESVIDIINDGFTMDTSTQPVHHFILSKARLNSDDQQFHQYQQSEQFPLISIDKFLQLFVALFKGNCNPVDRLMYADHFPVCRNPAAKYEIENCSSNLLIYKLLLCIKLKRLKNHSIISKTCSNILIS